MAANIKTNDDSTSGSSQSFETDVSCLNVKAIYDYVSRKAPQQAQRLFENLPARYKAIEYPEVELTDENNWVSSELIVQVFKNAKEILDDPEAPYHIGFDSIAQRDFGYIQKFFIQAFGSPGGVLKRINHVNSQFNTTKVVETIYSGPNRAVVRLHWKENKILSADICRYNRGIYAAIPAIWNRPPSTIIEPFCQFEGDPYCQFNMTFYTGKHPVKRFFGSFRTTKTQLLSAIEQIDQDKLVLKKKYDEVNTLNLELADKIEKLKAINTASNLLVSIGNTDEILSTTASFIVDIMQFDRAIIMLVDEAGENLVYKYAFGGNPKDVDKHLKDYQIPLRDEDNILARIATLGRPTMVKDAKNEEGLDLSNRILANFDVSSFIICPLMASEGMIGILAVDRYKSKKEIAPRDIDELAIFTNTIAETLHKAQLKEEIETSYLNTVRALVRAIEEKDSYTRGHSERVAELSVEIGGELGMSAKNLEFLRLGCLLHDVGKIGISEAIVKSPKSLTDPEYNIIKRHPVKGTDIVRPISFLKDYLYIIRNHHERFDGNGYPDGLQADNIPLGAQITCVADAFDAMTSTRPYRKGLPAKEACSRIRADSGSQFSPIVVDAFINIYNRNKQ
ncbi:MAG: HD domain-containing protein [Spirochaetales bacterium]|jgi:putative nucleotidyltransferase with HDIG domain|nr:HD domain-containing protein [Spirochaetales bacterium]